MERSIIFVITLSMLTIIAGVSFGTAIHVGLGGGYTFNTIQAGINASQSGDTVIVHDGTYTGTGNRNIDFGGRNITLRSANGWQNTTINLQGVARAFYFHSGETRNAVVEGFNVVNGTMTSDGAAIYSTGSSPTIKSCRFYNNIASGTTRGGAIAFGLNSDGAVIDCIFDRNVARSGGGLSATDGSDIDVIGSFFYNNNSGFDGAGMWTHTSTVDVESSIFAYNTGGGGARFNNGECSVTNSLFFQNSARYTAGIQLSTGHLTVRNSTVADNFATESFGGGIFMSGYGILTMSDSIVWGNDLSSIYLHEWATVDSITYSDLEGGWMGLGNINTDPLFLDALNGNYRISALSPAVDAAIDVGVYTDLDGNIRPFDALWANHGGLFDMGAYEVVPEPSILLLIIPGIIALLLRLSGGFYCLTNRLFKP
jgi:hypothetical protein